LQRTSENEVDDGPARVEHVFDDEGGRVQLRVLGRFAMGRMNKNRCVAPIELVEDRIEQRIPQVTVIYTGKETHAIEVQDVESIRAFLQSSLSVRQGKESEGAESRRMFEY